MTTTAELRQLAVAALKGATAAGDEVYAARTWPTTKDRYPVMWLHTPVEEKEGLGRNGAPQYTVTATLRISVRVQVPTRAKNAGAEEATVLLEAFQRRIERILINNPALMERVQQFPFIRSEIFDDSEGDGQLAELVMDIGIEFYQGPEYFYPIDEGPDQGEGLDAAAAAAAIAAIAPVSPLLDLRINNDLVNVVDSAGTYADPPFPDAVTPAPRTSGPDGRNESGLTFEFTPQE